ncbi:hypothetical protein JKF63_06982 [Porcisia hertigi]|uniref:Uncharacterized protein n=1 Tax=Porcisia hertigi TaxID=2761500 RepID=A0A836IZQ2_9TRYP|nr:hypothetical protein JKF63_06982 [Porcisia hertigi]
MRSLRADLNAARQQQQQQQQRSQTRCDPVDAAAGSLRGLTNTLRHRCTQHTEATSATRGKSAQGDSQLRPVLPLRGTPQVSSIHSAGRAYVGSIVDPSLECTTTTQRSHQRTRARAPAPSSTPPAGKSRGHKDASVALADSPATCEVSSFSDKTGAGLTPSAVSEWSRSGEAATADALWAPSPSPAPKTTSDGGSPVRCRLTTAQLVQHTKPETLQARFDDQDAMSYLLSVFSSIEATCGDDGVETEVMPKTSNATPCKQESRAHRVVRSPTAPPLQQQQRPGVARQLFHCHPVEGEEEDSEIEDEHTKGETVGGHRSYALQTPPPRPSCEKQWDKHSRALTNRQVDGASDEECQLFRERYARMVACALAAEFTVANSTTKDDKAEHHYHHQQQQQQQQGCETEGSTPVASRCRSTTAPHDHSASETVASLLRLFTPPPTPAPVGLPTATYM